MNCIRSAPSLKVLCFALGCSDEMIAMADARAQALAEEQKILGPQFQAPRFTSQDIDLRRNTCSMFLKAMPGRKCENCKAISPGFRKDGFTKIFRIPLNAKQQKQMEALDMHVPGMCELALGALVCCFVCSFYSLVWFCVGGLCLQNV